jgi:mannose-6-phosphate isomerase-like protein (cupin superfamily)
MNRNALIIIGLLILVVISGLILVKMTNTQPMSPSKNLAVPQSYHGNVVQLTEANTNFRQVIFTGLNSQLVIMSIPSGGEVGEEIHKYTEQTLFFLSGTGEGELNGAQFPIVPGDVVVVVPGTDHNFWNTGKVPLQIYTTYAPPNHLPGLIEATKADADANVADEAIGNTPPTK